MIQLFHTASNKCSKIITAEYSTSFSTAIKLLHPRIRSAIYNIYGFVRVADEIVDTFHDFDKKALLADFKIQTFRALSEGISVNPVLHSFQQVVREYQVNPELVEAFFESMQMDLYKTEYDARQYKEYIYGSAEVVGLMCLHVFCEGDGNMFRKLQPSARALGAAFQKINFLRDLSADFQGLNRTYFPGVDFHNFTEDMKAAVEAEVKIDLAAAYEGIQQLPLSSRYGVLLAYSYYASLFKKIQKAKPVVLLNRRVRVPDHQKLILFLRTGLRYKIKLAYAVL